MYTNKSNNEKTIMYFIFLSNIPLSKTVLKISPGKILRKDKPNSKIKTPNIFFLLFLKYLDKNSQFLIKSDPFFFSY